MSIGEDSAKICDVNLNKPESIDLSEKWCFTEAVLKCHGTGFGDISRVDIISKGIKTDLREIIINGKRLILATSIVK